MRLAEPRPRLGLLASLAALTLCLLHAWMAFSAGERNGPTYDELIHVASGRAYWETADYRFQPENGMLPQRLLALPLVGRDMNLSTDDRRALIAWTYADPWTLSRLWFFESGEDPAALLSRARLVNALLGACVCGVVFAWSRSLFGNAGGFFSLTLAAFCPNLLANAGLATSDTSAALGFSLALLAWWRLLHRVSPGRVAAAGAATAFVALSKYSALLLGPMVVALLLLRLARRAPLPLAWRNARARLTGKRRAGALVPAALAAGLLAWILIWAAYGFRYEISPNSARFEKEWTVVLLEKPDAVGVAMAGAPDASDFTTIRGGALQDCIRWARDHRVLPEGWLYGLAYVARNAKARMSYFAGEYSLTGWPAFFPVAFLAKTPPAGLVALAASLALIAAGRGPGRPHRYRCAPLLAGIAIYFAAALSSRLNIGYRHLLPILPPVWILAGAMVAPFAARKTIGRAALLLLLAGQALAAIAAAPFYLTYFNGPSGGAERGDRLFVDSSLDWGQGLPELDRWLRQNHRGETIHLSYFGSDEPRRFPWSFVRIADELFDHGNRPMPAPMRGGLYCLGATQFRRVYTRVRGEWSERYESAYGELSRWFAQHDLSRDPQGGAPLPASTIQSRLRELEHLRFGRLCRFLEQRDPIARPGNSILVFRLTDAEVWAALDPERRTEGDALRQRD